MGHIYMIRNKANGMVYIGQSINVRRRWNEELCGKTNAHLVRAFNKYGKDGFEFSILEECENAKMDEREELYIKYYDSANKRKGYNKTLGGNGYNCRMWSEETKKKFSEKMSGKNNPFYGKKHKPEMIQMLKDRRGEKHPAFGKKHSMESRLVRSAQKMGGRNPMAKKIYQYTKEGEFVAEYDAGAEASRITGVGKSGIKNCACGLTKSSGGYIWTYEKRIT